MGQSTTGSTQKQGGRRGAAVAAAVTLVLLVVAAVSLFLGFRGDGPHDAPPSPVAASQDATGQTPATTASPGAKSPSATTPTSTKPSTKPNSTPSAVPSAVPDAAFGDFLPASQPTKLTIPSIGLSSDTFVELTVQANGTLSVPGTEKEVGLYQAGPTPGQLGPAVLGAHVDTPDHRKGIFWNLGKVRVGDKVIVDRKDGTTATFTVDHVEAYKKTEFPTDRVYKGDVGTSEIRLVTCGGPVDSQNEYRDNVVVFGHLTSTS